MELPVSPDEPFVMAEMLCSGSATPMRGKSLTCREATSTYFRSATILSGHRPPRNL